MPRGVSRHRAAERQTTLILDSRTKAAFGADQNDLDLQVGSCFNLSTSGGARSVTGIAGGTEGRVIQLVNVGTDYIYLVNESTASVASNRILTALPSGQIFSLAPSMSVFLSYNNVAGRWLVMHSSVVFDPEVDTPLAAMLSGVRQRVIRGGGLMARSLGSDQNRSEARATGGNQTISSGTYVDVTSATTTFTVATAGIVKISARASIYSAILRNGSCVATMALDVDGSTYVIGTYRSSIAADISGGIDLQLYLTKGEVMSGQEALLLAVGSHTAKLKIKRTGDNPIVESVADAPSVVTAVW